MEEANTGLQLIGQCYFEKITNGGDFCSHLLKVVKKNNEEPALLINKAVLTKNKELFENDGSWELIDQNKDDYVFQQNFSIKLSTLEEINDWIKSLKIDN